MSDSELKIFEQGWPGNDTVCGWGSTLEHTAAIREHLPKIIRNFHFASINDAGCGDLFWIKRVLEPSNRYHGYDLYERASWEELRKEGWLLDVADITKDELPGAELVICRDVFIHLPNTFILQALDLLRVRHNYILTTTYDSLGQTIFNNYNRIYEPNLKHSKLDLEFSPYNLGAPLYTVPENYPGKATKLWRL